MTFARRALLTALLPILVVASLSAPAANAGERQHSRTGEELHAQVGRLLNETNAKGLALAVIQDGRVAQGIPHPAK